MKKLITFLFALAACAVAASPAFASFKTGETLNHMLSVCVEKKDAIEIVETDVAKGYEAAAEVWNAKEYCMTLPVQGPAVGKVVHSAKVKRDGKEVTVFVVEIVVDGKVQAYFLTTLPVQAVSWHPGGEKGTERHS